MKVAPKGADEASAIVIETEKKESCKVSARQLIPETTYTVTLELANGDVLDGTTTAEL